MVINLLIGHICKFTIYYPNRQKRLIQQFQSNTLIYIDKTYYNEKCVNLPLRLLRNFDESESRYLSYAIYAIFYVISQYPCSWKMSLKFDNGERESIIDFNVHDVSDDNNNEIIQMVKVSVYIINRWKLTNFSIFKRSFCKIITQVTTFNRILILTMRYTIMPTKDHIHLQINLTKILMFPIQRNHP